MGRGWLWGQRRYWSDREPWAPSGLQSLGTAVKWIRTFQRPGCVHDFHSLLYNVSVLYTGSDVVSSTHMFTQTTFA